MSQRVLPLAELEDFALELAQTAGGIAKAHFRRPLTVENKAESGFDPVTAADRAIERVLRGAIRERYPDHGIVAEEEGSHAARSAYTWFIDPIDGTRSFIMGSPLWGTLIGVSRHDVPLFGVLCQPVLEEVFFGAPGGSWLIETERRERLRSRQCETLADAALACTDPAMFDGRDAEAFERLAAGCRLHRFGGDCYNYAMLAAGFIDLVVEGMLKPFDIVPLVPILEGAGCVVTDWEGRPATGGGLVVAAATPALHAAALQLLRSSQA
jgi:histidinol phosphatase-like enzyme (inositol monophosphatase family)